MTARNSTAIADMVATPQVLVNPSKGAPGVLRESAGYVANAADDDDTSVFRFCRVPSNARVSEILLTTGDASSAGAVNIGLHQTEGNGGAVVDANLFATTLALTGGPFNNAQVIDSVEYTAAEQAKPLWEVLGLSSDPQIEYDVTASVSTTFNGAAVGQTLKVRYVI